MSTATTKRNGSPNAPARMDDGVKGLLTKAESKIAAVLPPHMTAAKVIQTANTLVYSNPDLIKCEPLSILQGVLEASELGLSLSKAAGEAYLVPYSGKAQFQPGYRGLVKLVMQSGEVDVIDGRLIRQGEVFIYRYTPSLEFVHEPLPSSEGTPVVGVYAVAKLRSGEWRIEHMTAEEVQRIRSRSRAKDSPAWKNDWNEMAKKTVLRRLCKTLPKSDQLLVALSADEREFEGGHEVAVSRSPFAQQRGTAALAARLGASKALPEPEATETPEVLDTPPQGREPGDDFDETERAIDEGRM